MKAKLIIIMFLVSLMLLATDSIIQALVALSGLGLSVRLMNGNREDVTSAIERMEEKFINLINHI